MSGQEVDVMDRHQIRNPRGVFCQLQQIRRADNDLALQFHILFIVGINIDQIIRVAMVMVKNFFPVNVVPNHQRSKVGIFIIKHMEMKNVGIVQ